MSLSYGTCTACAVLAGHYLQDHKAGANAVCVGATSKSKRKKNKKKGGSQGTNQVEDGAQVNGKHTETEADLDDDDADEEDEHTVWRPVAQPETMRC